MGYEIIMKKSKAAEELYAAWSVLGKPEKRKELLKKAVGVALFTNDVLFPDMLYAKALGSPYAHAKIESIDSREALELPGVKAVISYQEMIDMGVTVDFPPPPQYTFYKKALFVGDWIAAVAADDPVLAEEACDLIKVKYEELPFVLTGNEAAQPDAPQIHDDDPYRAPGNVYKPVQEVNIGDVAEGFKQADVVIEREYRLPSIKHMFTEPICAVAKWAGDELEVWRTDAMGLGMGAAMLAQCLGMPQNKVHFHQVYIGGHFGGKGAYDFLRYTLIAALLARKAGRPVKIVSNIRQSLVTNHVVDPGLPTYHYKVGAKKDGTLTAYDGRVTGSQGRSSMFNSGINGQLKGVLNYYYCPNKHYETHPYHTNRPDVGTLRAAGSQLAAFPAETIINELSAELGIDPLDFRLKNGIKSPHPINKSQNPWASGNLAKLAQAVADQVGWRDKFKGWGVPTSVNGSKRRGVALTLGVHSCGWGQLPSDPRQPASRVTAMVKVNISGAVDVLINDSEVGNGKETATCQVVAEVLGVDMKDVEHSPRFSTQPDGIGSYGSTGEGLAVTAAWNAAYDVKKKMLDGAATLLKKSPEELVLDIKHKQVYIKDEPEKKVTLFTLFQNIGCAMYGLGTMSPPQFAPDAIKDPVSGKPWEDMGGFASYLEVEVDTETGQLEVIDALTACQVGMILNPHIYYGQGIGGLVHGLSQMTGEGIIYDERTGTPLNGSLIDYPVWMSADVDPEHLDLFADVDPADARLFGFKGKGASEGIYCAVWGAFAEAVYNATSVWLREMPCRPEKILKALGKADFPVTKGVI